VVVAAPLVLAVAVGSSSKRYALYEGSEQRARVAVERGSGTQLVVTVQSGTQTEPELSWPSSHYPDAAHRVLHLLADTGAIESFRDIATVGVRVVAPGAHFARHEAVTGAYLDALRRATVHAPLHIPATVEELEELWRLLPRAELVAASDSAFHATLPDVARRYAIPADLAEKHGIERTGYHGLSIASVLRRLPEIAGQLPQRVVVCHLGSGASVTAIQTGESVDTSMGLTPLEGLPMNTRVGDIDPGALLNLLADHSPAELRTILTSESGLMALSGTTGDMKTLLERRADDPAARFAVDAFTYRVRKYIGAYAAALGGIDTLVFTGAIGERSAAIRKEIVGPLRHLGLSIDSRKNAGATGERACAVSSVAASALVTVIPTDELGEIARVVQ
jgi:acetate kinase